MKRTYFRVYGRNQLKTGMVSLCFALRVQRWLFSDLNPMMWPVKAMASYIRETRKTAGNDNFFRKLEESWSRMITGSLNLYRDLRDAANESAFFQIYGSLMAMGGRDETRPSLPAVEANLRELPHIKETLAAVEKGGYPEAVARIAALLGRFEGRIPLTRLETAQQFVRSDEVLSKISEDEIRRLKSEAAVLALLEPERTMQALPTLLAQKEDRDRAISLLKWALTLEGIGPLQKDFANSIIELLEREPAAKRTQPRRENK